MYKSEERLVKYLNTAVQFSADFQKKNTWMFGASCNAQEVSYGSVAGEVN